MMRILLSLLFSTQAFASALPKPDWIKAAPKKLEALENKYPGKLGVYVIDLKSGESASLNGEEMWYIASGAKLPMVVEALKQIDDGALSFDTEITFEKDDAIEGAGYKEYIIGKTYTVKHLLEQMLIISDNTASDLIIRQIGLGKINAGVKKLLPSGMGPLTTLGDVRRQVYANFHPAAANFKNKDYITLRQLPNDRERLNFLKKNLSLQDGDIKVYSLDEAFSLYYAKGMNTATLSGMARLLENVAAGRVLKPESTRWLLETMEAATTGAQRLKAGLAANIILAHKTGTQHKRLCDFGLIRDESDTRYIAALAVCTRGFAQISEGEEAIKNVAKTLSETGAFSKGLAHE